MFEFSKEMVYGKKHLNKINFDKDRYPLYKLLTNLFGAPLNQVHNNSEKTYALFTELGKDSNTEFHRKFYDRLDEGWSEFIDVYESFVSEVLLPYLGLEEALVQKYPTFRVQLPNNRAVVIEHHDSDINHKHPVGEINFIYALTDMFDSNSIKVEKMPRMRDFTNIELEEGECLSFNGNLCDHYNDINKTGVTRMSFDFRILPLNYYDHNYSKLSVTKSMKYIEGGYYKRLRITEKNKYHARDIWDKEKEKFNSTLQKYNVSDAWGVVDLFEKKMASYAGSKYAVSVDNCTNALMEVKTQAAALSVKVEFLERELDRIKSR